MIFARSERSCELLVQSGHVSEIPFLGGHGKREGSIVSQENGKALRQKWFASCDKA
jgi:hypothetical protein